MKLIGKKEQFFTYCFLLLYRITEIDTTAKKILVKSKGVDGILEEFDIEDEFAENEVIKLIS